VVAWVHLCDWSLFGMMVARYVGIVIVVIFCSGQLCAQADANKTSATIGPPANPWEFNLSVSGYYVPNGQSYASPTFTADHDTLHLEARYNYEGLRTGSLWVGYNLTVGKKLVLEATPMVGGVFGNVNGVAPGLEFTATRGIHLRDIRKIEQNLAASFVNQLSKLVI
jgi:hypothetical protein